MTHRPDTRGGPAVRPLSGAASTSHEGRSRPLSSVREFGGISRRERHDPERQLRGYRRRQTKRDLGELDVRILLRGFEKLEDVVRRSKISFEAFDRAVAAIAATPAPGPGKGRTI